MLVLEYPPVADQSWDALVGVYGDALVGAGANGATRVAVPLVRGAGDDPAVLKSFRAAIEALDEESVWTGDMELLVVVDQNDDLSGVVPRHSALAQFVRENFRERDEEPEACESAVGEDEPAADGAPAADEAPAADDGSEPADATLEMRAAETPAEPAPDAPAEPDVPAEPEGPHDDAPFSVALSALVDERGLRDSQVCRGANISRRLYSQIRGYERFQPAKHTALALAVALGLDVPQTEELLRCAGLSLSSTSRADVVVRYFIQNGDCDVYSINEALFAYGEPLL